MKSLNKENLIINCKTNIIIKKQAIKYSNIYLKDFLHHKKVLFIIDSFFKNKVNKLNYIKKSFEFFPDKSMFFNDYFEPNFQNLENIKKNFIDKKFDLIIGIGGGSTLDISKGNEASHITLMEVSA